MTTAIKINKNASVPKSQWGKVEALKIVRKGAGFTEYTDGEKIYRVTAATWTTAKKVHCMD